MATEGTHSLHEEPTRVEKPSHSPMDLESGRYPHGAPLGRQISVQLTPEQFEQLYLQPAGAAAKGDLAKRVGNPTPLGLLGFLICLTPFTAELMGWAGTSSAAAVVSTGAFYFVGGLSLYLAGLMEWIIGNTFPSTVFFAYGSFWTALGFFFQPSQGISSAFASAENELAGGFALYLAAWGTLTFLFLIASLRTNVVFVLLFFFLDIAFWLLVAVYLKLAHASLSMVPSITKAAGAFGFLCCCCGWWLLLALLLATTGIPLRLPVGDLSGFMARRPAKRD